MQFLFGLWFPIHFNDAIQNKSKGNHQMDHKKTTTTISKCVCAFAHTKFADAINFICLLLVFLVQLLFPPSLKSNDNVEEMKMMTI